MSTMTRQARDSRTSGAQGAQARSDARRRWWRRSSGKPSASPARRARFRRRLMLLGGLMAALVAGLVFLFFFSAAFTVKEVAVTGAEGELAAAVEERADIPRGRPLARVSESRVAERVLQDLRVADLSVETSWPSSVTLVVTPREPALVLKKGSDTWLADVSGVVYDQVESPSAKLPSVSVPSEPEALSEQTVRGLVELWRERPDPAELEGDLGRPRLSADGTVTLSVDQLTIEWGEPVEAEKKWSIIAALIAQESIDPQGAVPQKIDVSLPDTPVVTGIPPASG